MEQEFFLEELASLMNVPVYRYNCRTKEIRSFRKEGMDSVPEKEAAGEFGQELLLQPVPYPLIRLKQSDKNVIYIQVRDPKEAEAWYLIGPVFPGAAGEARRLNRLISGGLLLYWYLTGQHMDAVEFWNCNEKIFCDTHKVWEQVEQDIFEQQEQYGPHNPYEQELRELESIRTGDVEELNRSIAEVYEGRLGILAREPLRHHQNIAIGNITMASRAAIRGGVSTEQAFSMADSFIRQIEDLGSIPEVIALKREAQRAFAQEVRQEQKSGGGYAHARNPLIAGVKDYIFSHLHDAIQIADIARHLHVNADYLSHLFKVQEHMTMKQYIQEEKVRRGKNLLRYSDVSIHEIAFYLGFSSQSHFTQVFQKIAGETPNHYRKRFLNQKSWEM